jgi:hypothetical protein
MSLHLDVICEPHVSLEERASQTVRVIGEVLPYVLAKYGVRGSSVYAAGEVSVAPGPRRFEIQ